MGYTPIGWYIEDWQENENTDSRNWVFNHYMGTVDRIVKSLCKDLKIQDYALIEDLEQEGYIILLDAISTCKNSASFCAYLQGALENKLKFLLKNRYGIKTDGKNPVRNCSKDALCFSDSISDSIDALSEIEFDHNVKIFEKLEDKFLIEDIWNAVGFLSPREQKVLKLRFESGMSLSQVADMENVCIERIRQIETKAIRKLKHQVLSRKIKSYYED